MRLVAETVDRPREGLGRGSGAAGADASGGPSAAELKAFIPAEALSGATDDLLVRAALAGQKEAFNELVGRYTNMVLCYINARVRNQLEAEEITQEAMVRAYTQLPRLRAPRAFSNWVLSIANAVMCDRRRHDSKLIYLEESGRAPETSSEPAPIDRLSDEEAQGMVFEQMQRLPVHYRVALAMKYINGLSVEEIADRLQVPPGTVRARLSRAYRVLRRRFETASAGNAVPGTGVADEEGAAGAATS